MLGGRGAADLIRAAASRPAGAIADRFPEAAAANRSIFYRDGRAATVGEVYANLTKTAGDQGAVGAAPVTDPEDGGFIRYAAMRRTARQHEQDALVALILRGSQPADQTGVGSRLTGSLFTSEMLRVLSDSRDG